MITNETTKNLNLAKHPFGLGNREYYIQPFNKLRRLCKKFIASILYHPAINSVSDERSFRI
jgi:hypothetical protein